MYGDAVTTDTIPAVATQLRVAVGRKALADRSRLVTARPCPLARLLAPWRSQMVAAR